jgi:hypothetical protein
LNNWQEIVPAHWIPIRVSGEKFISPSIRAAGLYQDYCDHYVNLFLLGLWNKVRMSQIETKNIIVSCLSELPSSSSDPVYLSSAQSGIQTLIDDICASIPYYLGDRTEPGNHPGPLPDGAGAGRVVAAGAAGDVAADEGGDERGTADLDRGADGEDGEDL